MLTLGPLGFAAPWALAALALLPGIWWLARATPPAPKRVRFPALSLLLGLKREEETPERTPPLLLALRMLAAALVIFALASPVWRPAATTDDAAETLVIVIDDGWAAAPDWDARLRFARGFAEEAIDDGRPVRVLTTAARAENASDASFDAASNDAVRGFLRNLAPKPWASDRAAAAARARALADDLPGRADVRWIADGVAGEDDDAFARDLRALGALTIYDPRAPWRGLALANPRVEAEGLSVRATRANPNAPWEGDVVAYARDGRALARARLAFASGERESAAVFDLPVVAANDVARVAVLGATSAGATALLDEAARRRIVGVVDVGLSDDQPLLAGGYYLRRALEPFAEIVEGDLDELLLRDPSVLILPDVGQIVGSAAADVARWVEEGGVLLRFAGPRTASGQDDLTPVRLRRGGRALGGALSWGEPQSLQPFEKGPFVGLVPPDDVVVRRQVLAEPALDLNEKTWARLQDGTPLVTAEARGEGRVILVHVTADPAWSDLPLSGLFPAMLERVTALSATRADPPTPGDALAPVAALDGFGALAPATGRIRPIVAGQETAPSPETPPGLYGEEGAAYALNLFKADARPVDALAADLAGVATRPFDAAPPRSLRGPALAAAVFAFIAECVFASVLLGGLAGLGRRPAFLRRSAGAAASLLVAASALGAMTSDARAQEAATRDAAAAEARALEATLETRLAYVLTGDAEIDRLSRQGLVGLSNFLTARSASEPAEPAAVDLARDDFLYYPLLYWPVTEGQASLSDAARAKVDAYLKSGGAILFDTRDQHLRLPGRDTPQEEALRRLLEGLDIPPLGPTPDDHVLRRSFYLIQDFPGRWTGDELWLDVGAGGGDGGDGVAAVFIGSHDWAGAWAVDERGRYVRSVPARQREYAYRFGVNLVMYVLTGNYKRDQVHVRLLLERLGE